MYMPLCIYVQYFFDEVRNLEIKLNKYLLELTKIRSKVHEKNIT